MLEIIDKNNIIPRLSPEETHILELGCGDRKRLPNSIGVDQINYQCVDIVGDVFAVLSQIPDQSISAVYSNHFFEHVDNLSLLVDELARIIKPEGQLNVTVPHFSNPYFYSDATHRTFFGLYTFCYFAKNNLLQRKTPTYNRDIQFELSDVRLGFKSAPPFYVRHGIKLLLEQVFNLNTYMKEFYEENLCYLFPCYEVKYSLKRL
uniref:Methyltransferase type 11 n=1 Tax=Cyanothece sp. (strain PCC 7425 / ATCC 29141) TaxID=395961 RepID=B8HTN7_CYAP4